jgi:hypothetical protein
MSSPQHKRRPAEATAAESASPPGRGALVGYARVSTDEQNLALQLDALKQAGCERVHKDVGSGSLKHRPELDACLDYLRAGDTLVVWRLDRLGRGLKHLIEAIEQLHAREIGFRSLTEAIDTTTNAGMLQFHIFGALAEFERQIIRERTRAGLGDWCQTRLPKRGENESQKRPSERPSTALRRTSVTDLAPENADFDRANRDFTKNTTLLARVVQ